MKAVERGAITHFQVLGFKVCNGLGRDGGGRKGEWRHGRGRGKAAASMEQKASLKVPVQRPPKFTAPIPEPARFPPKAYTRNPKPYTLKP
jgi:hypothetical protein